MIDLSNILIPLLLLVAGLVAGMIDSVAGGGGLVTVPLLSILIGPGSLAIGTNKVAAVGSTALALAIYVRGGHVRLAGNLRFAIFAGVGAVLGALTSPSIPAAAYKWILLIICPIILFVVYKKNLWARVASDGEIETGSRGALLWALGFVSGFYDGIAGPGGGTLMFLSLFLVAKLPLMTAMATAKIANLTTAGFALASFAATSNVRWDYGAWMALGISAGAAGGATYVHRNAAKQNVGPIARAALLIIALILLVRLALSS